jgi:quercetin dioxygenase-like cupin family protein
MQMTLPRHSGRNDDLGRFLAEVESAATAARAVHPGLSPDFDILVAALAALPVERVEITPGRQPVCRHLEAAFALAASGPAALLIRALRPIAGRLFWHHSYDVDDALPGFSRNFAYTEVVGPSGNVPSLTMRCGLILMAPWTVYPAHAHAATEIYHVLGGLARWRCGDEPWALRPPGSFILHPSMIPHAMETDAEPLLALYAWYGEMTGGVAFVEGAVAGRVWDRTDAGGMT